MQAAGLRWQLAWVLIDAWWGCAKRGGGIVHGNGGPVTYWQQNPAGFVFIRSLPDYHSAQSVA